MRVVSLPNSFYHICRHLPPDLTPKAQEGSRWLALREEGLSSTEASHVLALPRSTLYRWQKRLKEQGPRGLEEGSHRPEGCSRNLPGGSLPAVAYTLAPMRCANLGITEPIILESWCKGTP